VVELILEFLHNRPTDIVPVPGDDFPFGDELVYRNSLPAGYTLMVCRYGLIGFSRSLDLDGFRI